MVTDSVPAPDFSSPAEMFEIVKGQGHSNIKHHRFDTLALAVQFAVETMDERRAKHTVIEADEERFDHVTVLRLYQRGDYPLERVR